MWALERNLNVDISRCSETSRTDLRAKQSPRQALRRLGALCLPDLAVISTDRNKVERAMDSKVNRLVMFTPFCAPERHDRRNSCKLTTVG
jgi:hypothetical protein